MIDLITVVYREELCLLKIQALSIQLYIDSNRIGNVYVIVNDGIDVVGLIDTTWWGVNSQKVIIIHRLAHGNFYNLDGWSSQQIHKLLAARDCQSEWSMCLDAKTWFVRPLDWDKLFTDGRVNLRPLASMPQFTSSRQFVESFYNVQMVETIGPGGVPFMFHTTDVVEMISGIECRTGMRFSEFFTANVYDPHRLTEFILYSGFIMAKYGSYDALYSSNQYYGITNLDYFEVDQFNSKISQMRTSLTASFHRRMYSLLSTEQLSVWGSFLADRQLISSSEVLPNF